LFAWTERINEGEIVASIGVVLRGASVKSTSDEREWSAFYSQARSGTKSLLLCPILDLLLYIMFILASLAMHSMMLSCLLVAGPHLLAHPLVVKGILVGDLLVEVSYAFSCPGDVLGGRMGSARLLRLVCSSVLFAL
jgi:hypothetical protein